MEGLLAQLTQEDTSSEGQRQVLEKIKIRGRDSQQALILSRKENLATLSRYAFCHENTQVSSEALKCIANLLLLHEASRQSLVDLGHAKDLVIRLSTSNDDDEFLASRILFLLTYNTSLNFSELVEQHRLAEIICGHTRRHVERVQKQEKLQPSNPITPDMALSETLKLLFNITHFHPQLGSKFSPVVDDLSQILVLHHLSTPPLQPPTTLLLNALMNLDLTNQSNTDTHTNPSISERSTDVFPVVGIGKFVDRSIEILDRALNEQSEKELDSAAASLITLLRRVNDVAHEDAKQRMREQLLPSTRDRERPLGQGASLPARLLRLSVSPGATTLRDNVSGLLYELSNKDPTTFIHNVGYGYASGFLLNNNITLPTQPDRNQGVNTGVVEGEPVNPITGQTLSAELRDSVPEPDNMTEEEREREAERLFVLFERLRATGVVDVQNPLQRAVEEGRFEELPD